MNTEETKMFSRERSQRHNEIRFVFTRRVYLNPLSYCPRVHRDEHVGRIVKSVLVEQSNIDPEMTMVHMFVGIKFMDRKRSSSQTTSRKSFVGGCWYSPLFTNNLFQ